MHRSWNTRRVVAPTLTVVVGSVWLGLCAGQMLEAAESLEYWPHAAGTAWVYHDSQSDSRQDMRVVEPQVLDGESVTVLERRADGRVITRAYFAVRAGRILEVAEENPGHGAAYASLQRLTPPSVVLPQAVAVGARWGMTDDSKATDTVVERQEQITVPAGTYTALVLVSTAPTGRVTTQWLAPRVGIVRTVTEWPKTGRRRVTELVRFAPATPAVPSP